MWILDSLCGWARLCEQETQVGCGSLAMRKVLAISSAKATLGTVLATSDLLKLVESEALVLAKKALVLAGSCVVPWLAVAATTVVVVVAVEPD